MKLQRIHSFGDDRKGSAGGVETLQGVRQGDSLSTTLCNAALEGVIRATGIL